MQQQILRRHFINFDVREESEDFEDEGLSELEHFLKLWHVEKINKKAAIIAGPGKVHQLDSSERSIPNRERDWS